ncbi:MAG: flavin reductase family protein [bacterium]
MKKELGAKNCLYPLPTTLVGALVEGKPNFIAIAHVGILSPGTISLGINKAHYTNAGILEHKTFSVNFPSLNQIEVTDYCGLVSGRDVNKGRLFDVFYGNLKTAPMARECPLNMGCRLLQTLDFKTHDIFIGEIVETFCDEEALTEDVVDLEKLQPFLFSMHDRSYWTVGEKCGLAWHEGKAMIKKF